MVAIYYILALIVWIFGAIFLLIFSFKSKYKHSIPARFFLFKNPSFKEAQIHFHACSFGEIQALKPIMQMFEDKAISVVTNTGFEAASKISANTRFLPFEIFLPFWLKPSKVLVVFEAELWLMLVAIAKAKGAKVLLVNARISDRSYKRYLKFAFFYRKIFSFIDVIYAQSQIDKERLSALGAKNIIVNGNIKSAFLPQPSKKFTKPKERVIVLASTHEGEEKILLDSILPSQNDKFIVAPRHPERFAMVKELVKAWAQKHKKSFASFSQSKSLEADVILLDTLGELVNFYAISDVVVLGGSFVPNVGGHNPIEAAQFKNAIISGKHIFNQKSLFTLLKGVYNVDVSEVNSLLQSELEICQIAQKGDANIIIDEIRRGCGTGKSI
ncbi:lipid IV(A) 3-deoxy-D-manno-octulosonic acid transferase [Campylobacter suis]|uniref:3-deoxy-D-manno-octulosonic acid transferase n=1 Tax=Campylobacter suis TaxID=2790657 RepID=A0ABM8Q133_9BACT|nr:lipid IV(A) 3-deoxy-D-manno-octulosonic acid transferase [Campylobacter suis]CAD7286493.1 3-deoxy-D-manno-octulosonic acid transferase [Campylobacter suis]